MPFVQRFTVTSAGALTFTGNALSLSKINNQLLPGNLDASGAFITTNTGLTAPGWFPGTTLNYTQNSSAAVLRLPAGSTIEYAELIWSANYSSGVGNVTPNINDPIQFITPLGAFTISPETTFDNVSPFNPTTRWYTHSANVTSLVQAGGAGTYITGSVPAFISAIDNQTTHSGWTLAVSYRNSALPFRNKSIFVGQDLVGLSITNVDITVSGFSSPTTGNVTGRILLSAHDGDPFAGGDVVRFGPNTSSLVTLSGPNNLVNNFFQAQINNDSGNLDTAGTFGTRNAVAGDPGFYTTGSRLAYDITNVDGSAGLFNSQTSGVLRITTSADVILPNGIGIQIDVNQPLLSIDKTSSTSTAREGDIITYTAVITNSGAANADNVIFTDPIPAGTTFIPNSVTIDGGPPQTGLSPIAGINLGSIPVGGSRTVTFQVQVNTGGVPPQISNTSSATFTFISVPGGPVLAGDVVSNEVIVNLIAVSITKTATPTSALPGQDVLYTVTVFNTGGATLTNVRVTDATLGLNETLSMLTPGNGVRFEISFTIPPGTPAGSIIVNRAAVVTNEISDEAFFQVNVLAAPSLSINKTADRTMAAPGDTIFYTIEVSNTGNSTLTNVRVVDALLGIDTLIGTLLQGESQFVFGEFTVPIGSSGTITNTTTATSDETTAVSDSETVMITPQPSLFVRKRALEPEVEAGSAAMFEIEYGNAGNVTLTNVVVSDPQLNINEVVPVLEPGEAFIITGALDIPFGTPPGTVITNTVTVSSDQVGTQTAQANVTVTQPAFPIIELSKFVDRETTAPGETITYTIIISNTGFISLTNVNLIDPLLGINQVIPEILPSDSFIIESDFFVPLDTPDGSSIVNTATATSDQTLPVETTNILPVQSIFGLEITKTVEPTTALPGDEVQYTIIVRNTGNRTLINVRITDPIVELDTVVDSLVPGGEIEITSFFTIPAGTPIGNFENTATASADNVTTQSFTANVEIGAAPDLTITKTADQTSVVPGATVTYTILVTNSGNVPLSNVIVQDPLLGIDQTIPLLASGAEQTITQTFLIPVATPALTVFLNTVTASSDQTAPITAQERIIVEPIVGLQVSKTVSPTEAAPGTPVEFSITVSNLSAVTLTNILMNDPLVGFTQTIPSLAPGASQVLLVPFTIPSNELPGSFVNTVEAFANETDTVTGTATVAILPVSLLTIAKVPSQAVAVPGEPITYTFQITNSGNTDITNVRITDPLLQLDNNISIIPVGTTVELVIPFDVPRDFTGTVLTNTATISSDQTAAQQVEASIEIIPDFTVQFTKVADRSVALPGERVNYTITITNSSTFTLTNLRLFDPVIDIEEQVTRLEPGATLTFSASFIVPLGTEAGTVIVNEAVFLSDETVVQRASASVTVGSSPQLILTKTASKQTAMPGERIQFRLRLRNTGNVPLTGVVVTDPLLNIRVEARAPIGPGESREAIVPFTVPSNAVPGTTITNTLNATSNETGLVSTSVSVNVAVSPLQVVKSANRKSVVECEIVTYTILLRNTSSSTISGITVTDNIPAGSTFVVGSLKLNGCPVTNQQLETGITIPDLAPGQQAEVTFKVKVEPIKKSKVTQLVNQAVARFTFRDSQGRTITTSTQSNQVIVAIKEEQEE
ncbi:DUF7507 domain-containing protein [Paenibacillus arenosi]|uniref:DUF11 domain-containing protein n=1 Tax=Paenibacillus arenosi TaxID=2774142 RepID=A0ABR9AWA0_9BACL|nr:DUF11 domain-containing protein [Paenibacillus arenosi]MBD8497226.1 DUF11 domain-containing protein [Paenibacillus arenosi]